MLKHLVISADSMIGGEICNAIGAIGTTRRSPSQGRIPFDLGNKNSRDVLPDAAVTYFCSGINGFKECQDKPAQARFINVECVVDAAADMVERGGRVILLSSCASETHPESVYGQLKLETENAFLQFGDKATIFRFGPVMYPGRNTYQNRDYHPIALSKLIDILTAGFPGGLHRILNAPLAA